MTPSAPPRRRRRRPQASFTARFWWVGLLVPALAVGGIFLFVRAGRQADGQLEGYVTDMEVVREEYQRYFGKTLQKPDVEQQFQHATQLALKRDYSAAAATLEGVLATAAVPVVYNDLGVLYAALMDRSRALNAFREALSHDTSYRPVRLNLDRLKAFLANSADPVSLEVESNDSSRQANPIAIGTAVNAEITGGDVDFFKVSSPPPPRDMLAIELIPTPGLAAALRICDSELRLVETPITPEKDGLPLTLLMAPAPNFTLYFQVWGLRNTAGSYTLKVRATRSYDNYEPNDDIFSAQRLEIGSPVEAGIMDTQDTDYYSFIGNRSGPITVGLRNRSGTLIPALTTFDSGRRNTGFGPDVRTPGADLRHTLNIENGRTYYLQVWGQANSSGDYSLTLQ